MEDYTDWLHNYILGRQYSEPVLAGHSLGSAVAQSYALKYPQEIKGLILIGAGARLRVAPQILSLIRDGIENPSAWAQSFVDSSLNQVAPGLREEMAEEMAQVGPAVMLNDMLCCDKFDIMDKVEQIQIPTLIICGGEDMMTPPKYSSYLANKIKGAKLLVLDGGTHLVFAEKPGLVNQAIQQFLTQLYQANNGKRG